MASQFENFVNNELPLREIVLKGNGAPGAIQAPRYAQYVDETNDDRYEQRGLGVNNDWVKIKSGIGISLDDTNAIIETKNCLSSLQPGVLVVHSDSITNGVDKALNNTDVRRVIGYVLSKPTATTCRILRRGTITGLSGLTKVGSVFLGTTGGFDTVTPTSGYVQLLGESFEVGSLDFEPQLVRTKRSDD